MPFRLHIVRHAEGTHNEAHDTTIHDPKLTETGIKQSQKLCHDFRYKEKVGLVITSPLKRTIQTALIGFEDSLNETYYAHKSGVAQGAELLLEPDVQAHSARPCDTGSEWSNLKSEFPDLPWDTFQLDGAFPEKIGRYAPEWDILERRGRALQRTIKKRFLELEGHARTDIVVVTHGGFIKFITGDAKMGFGPAKWGSFWLTFDEESRLIVTDVITE